MGMQAATIVSEQAGIWSVPIRSFRYKLYEEHSPRIETPPNPPARVFGADRAARPATARVLFCCFRRPIPCGLALLFALKLPLRICIASSSTMVFRL